MPSWLGQLTSPDIGVVLSEEAAIIVPFGEVSIHWPALAQLDYAVAGKFLLGATIDMVAEELLGLLSRNIIEFALVL